MLAVTRMLGLSDLTDLRSVDPYAHQQTRQSDEEDPMHQALLLRGKDTPNRKRPERCRRFLGKASGFQAPREGGSTQCEL